MALAAELIKKIHPKWNPMKDQSWTLPRTEEEGGTPEEDNVEFNPNNEVTELKDAITIFSETKTELAGISRTAPQSRTAGHQRTVVYTDGACLNNGDEDARAGSGIWYGDGDPRNRGVWVPHKEQSNQTGELMAVLLAVKDHPPNEDLHIVSDSKYVIEGLTTHVKKWEERNWLNIRHGDIFKCITAWLRWRSGKTSFQWVKGHNGTKGNEEADSLANEGANKPMPEEPAELNHPTN